MKYVTTCEPKVDENSHKELLFLFSEISYMWSKAECNKAYWKYKLPWEKKKEKFYQQLFLRKYMVHSLANFLIVNKQGMLLCEKGCGL